MFKGYKLQKNIVNVALVILLIISFFIGFFQLNKQYEDTTGIGWIKSMAVAQVNINQRLNNEGKTAHEENENEDKNIMDLLYLLSCMVVLGGTTYVIKVMVFMLTTGFSNLYNIQEKIKKKLLSRMKHYKVWYVKFLSPVEKCMWSRVDEYDINPIRKYGGNGNPDFVLKKAKSGFFYYEFIKMRSF